MTRRLQNAISPLSSDTQTAFSEQQELVIETVCATFDHAGENDQRNDYSPRFSALLWRNGINIVSGDMPFFAMRIGRERGVNFSIKLTLQRADTGGLDGEMKISVGAVQHLGMRRSVYPLGIADQLFHIFVRRIKAEAHTDFIFFRHDIFVVNDYFVFGRIRRSTTDLSRVQNADKGARSSRRAAVAAKNCQGQNQQGEEW